jgi:SAM-dependent methyltransferase
VSSIYQSGEYLEATKSWHAEDAPWKAGQILAMMRKNALRPGRIAEIGCGSGAILGELSKDADLGRATFEGYDISPQAIGMARRLESERVKFFQQDLLAADNRSTFDVLLIIDVLEHIPDYMGFAERCRAKAAYKIYHIPLDLHVSSVMRNAFLAARYSIGHIHYFTADSAIDTLKDTGHEILDYTYTNIASGLFMQHPSAKKALANLPRWLLSRVNLPLAARLLGGWSLLVLAR